MAIPALQIDKEKVKMVALQIGVREAARQCGIAEGTVQAWSSREGWFAQKAEVDQVIQEAIARQPLATRDPMEVMFQYKGKTKLAQAKTVYKTARHFSKMQPVELVKRTADVKNNVDSAAKLWPEATQDNRTLVNINLGNVRLPEA